jgi:cytochrome c5
LSHNDKQFATVFVVVLGALAVLAIILFFIAGYLTKEVSTYKEEEIILGNIEPVGKVNIDDGSAPQTPSAPEAAAGVETTAAAAEPLSGEQIYQKNCMACHTTGAAGAPKLGDAAAWAPRIAKGMDTVMANVTNGLNAMPPKGLCMTCSEDELKSVVDYILSQSQ